MSMHSEARGRASLQYRGTHSGSGTGAESRVPDPHERNLPTFSLARTLWDTRAHVDDACRGTKRP